MQTDLVARADWRGRVSTALDRVEYTYLRILRAAVLVVATIMIGVAIWLAISGLVKSMRTPDSVIEKEAVVEADDLIKAPISEDRAPEVGLDSKPVPSASTRKAYDDRLNRYFNLYRTRFEPHRQAEDKTVTRDEFDDQYLKTGDRAASVASGQLDERTDLAELDRLISVMASASKNPKTVAALKKYQAAKKVQVVKSVERTRSEVRQGWDSSSTSCEEWYYRPYGCPTQRLVSVPYTESVQVMEFPKGTTSHGAIFNAYHQRYNQLLTERRAANAADADYSRQSIMQGRVEGGLAMWTALQITGAFLALMFFFLLIAIERHQRKLTATGSQ